ncbi:reticulon-like protein B12 isoform X3 [Juglans microcarpa x Juglans regia]|uniref:reticulon-like protein B12 isoform X3 n=1 Tax=Juglans microcarpa x Juglans regia TaxID=2249226 RepID=UPI001B7E9146|nr:reticulon-like protein B12 isoform X3 [Juglans microcarpa x Juglans regia]
MSSSGRLFNRQRSVHEILGGGLAADVILWKRKDVTLSILLVTLAAWVVFEKSGYTLLSLVSSVFLLLIIILFLWAKAASILNRPAPPLPDLHLSEEMVNEVANFIRLHVNNLLSVSQDIALGLVIILTIPALYEKFEDHIDKYGIVSCRKLQQLYVKLDQDYIRRVQKWILEKKKLS